MKPVSSRKPLIGISCNWRSEENGFGELRMDDAYARSIGHAGGVAVLIPTDADADALAELLDGLLIPGGADIDPQLFGEEPHKMTRIVARPRFEMEWALVRAFEARRKPILGICYGAQLLNVWRGGSLHQHLPDLPTVTLRHRRESGELENPRHFVRLERDSRLYALIGQEQFEIVSVHHQAVHKVGRGLRIVAHAPDGVIEGIEDPDLPFFIGVQWHPERDPDAPATRALFEAFIRACRGEPVGSSATRGDIRDRQHG
ncbi:MAG: gamma-glutamyl-gamma-aminobutyrate hydrolase family protein [Fimbriimonadales bacterium]|nr:gamma-glutamyl-gamma-aminobutyrate hydrolase family protein [Fimbriimonadales bacterium]